MSISLVFIKDWNMKIFIGLVILFATGLIIGHANARVEVKIIQQVKTEYIKDPDSVSKSALVTEVTRAKKDGYTFGYAEGRKVGRDEGYKTGYTQGTEHGKSLILDQIDLRVKEGEKTDKVVPLFKVKQ